MNIRPIEPRDEIAALAIAVPIVRASETYPLYRDLPDEAILEYWRAPDKTVFVAEIDDRVVGLAYLRPNNGGGGSHVANAGFMVAQDFTGKGVARALCTHVLDQARMRGFRSMQFNFVISTNHRAIALWRSFGFEILTRLPEAFEHPTHGYVDALIMFKQL